MMIIKRNILLFFDLLTWMLIMKWYCNSRIFLSMADMSIDRSHHSDLHLLGVGSELIHKGTAIFYRFVKGIK